MSDPRVFRPGTRVRVVGAASLPYAGRIGTVGRSQITGRRETVLVWVRFEPGEPWASAPYRLEDLEVVDDPPATGRHRRPSSLASPATIGDHPPTMDDPDALLPVGSAGNVAGISPRTLRYWIKGGKLPATEGTHGRLVRLGDVLALAELTGKRPSMVRHAAGSPATATEAATSAGNDDGSAGSMVAMTEAARLQLAAIRDEFVLPLVGRIGELERTVGTLTAEREAEVQRRVAAERELEALRWERDRLAERVSTDHVASLQAIALAAERDVAVARLAEVEASLTKPTTAQDAPSASPEALGAFDPWGPTQETLMFRWRRWLRRVTGG